MSSLAWNTIAILAILLPGFAFFVGLYSPERYSRDIGRQNTIGELALAVFVSLFTHFVLLLILNRLIPCFAPNFDLIKFGTLLLTSKSTDDLIGLAITKSAWICGYLLVAPLIAGMFGYVTGKLAANGHLPIMVKHKWVLNIMKSLREEGKFVVAYVMTNITHDTKVMMYKGYVEEFFVGPGGNISYLILKNCVRSYMILADERSKVSEPEFWQAIDGETNRGQAVFESPYLMIKGDDIVNIAFNTTRTVNITSEGEEVLGEALKSDEPMH